MSRLKFLLLLLPTALFGAQLQGDISADSEIIMVFQGPDGASETLKLTSVNGETVIMLARDGEEHQAAVSHDAYLSLWQSCLDRDIDELEDAQPEEPEPDLAEFTLSFRIESTNHSFTVYGAEFVSDPRYLEIVKEILDVCRQYFPDIVS